MTLNDPDRDAATARVTGVASGSPVTRPVDDATRPGAMILVRSLIFNLAFWLWTALMVLVAQPMLALPRQAMLATARVWGRGIVALLRVLVGLRHEERGRERLPEEPVILAFKHQSAWETLMLALLVQDPVIVLKRELTRIPLFGWGLLHAGMIPIDRDQGSRALRSLIRGAEAALARGSSVVIFPEGTRVAPGERRPHHPGIAALYGRLDTPVVPVALNSGLFWARRGFVKRPGRIVVEFLEPIAPGLDRKAFMAELEKRLEGATARLVAEARAAGT
jgi:1-acyl-sn-glycerol-3-phosphate acyltransferase